MASVSLRSISKRFGAHRAVDNVSLDIADREFLVLVGPSGCGKTTILRMIAGLAEPTSGDIFVGDRRVNDVPARDRDIAMVFQSYALYPHMSVFENLAFPLRLRKVSKTEMQRRVGETAELLDITRLLKQKPKELSGGERQRVALGRAIVREPQVFLMDEPLSNLDAKLRVQTRAEIVKLQKRLKTTVIYVTHDQSEAMTMADRIVVLDRGLLQQVAEPERIYAAPANTFVAGFFGSPGMNFFPGRVVDGSVETACFRFPAPSGIAGEVVIGVRPEDLAITSPRDPATGRGDLAPTEGAGVHGSGTGGPAEPTDAFEAGVELVEPLGSETLVHLSTSGVDFVARVPPGAAAAMGDRVAIAVRADKGRLFDRGSGEALV